VPVRYHQRETDSRVFKQDYFMMGFFRGWQFLCFSDDTYRQRRARTGRSMDTFVGVEGGFMMAYLIGGEKCFASKAFIYTNGGGARRSAN